MENRRNNIYTDKTTKQLRQELSRLVNRGAEAIYEACCVIAELVDRGEQVMETRMGALKFYRKISRGELAPEAAFAFAHQDDLLMKIATLPLDRQKALARGEPIYVAEIAADGSVVGRDRRVAELSRRQFDMAVADGAIRPFSQQRKILEDMVAANTDIRRSPVPVNVRADTDTDEVVIGQIRVEAARLISALKLLGYEIRKKPTSRCRPAQDVVHASA